MMKTTDLQLTELSIHSIQETVTVVQFERRRIRSQRAAAVTEICDCRQKGQQERVQTQESETYMNCS